MITQELITELKERLGSLTSYKNKELFKRQEWGAINFEQVEADLSSVLYLATVLSELPLEHLSSGVASDISSKIPPVAEQLKRVDEFSLEMGGDPASIRNDICHALTQAAEELQNSASLYIPYLAYRRGDVGENIAKLNDAVDQSKVILNDNESWISNKKGDIEKIVMATQEAAASAGVATFTEEFKGEEANLLKRSKKWLNATAVFAVLTILAAILFYFWPKVLSDADGWDTLRNIISKAAILAVLFTGTIWCGRIYRALIHQAAVNKHRALSLKTFQAFVKATEDPYVKDAVLMAATQTVFASVSTGLVDQPSDGQDSGVNFVEFGRKPGVNLGDTAAS